jgi:hypothetical protein
VRGIGKPGVGRDQSFAFQGFQCVQGCHRPLR